MKPDLQVVGYRNPTYGLAQQRVSAGERKMSDVGVPLLFKLTQGIQQAQQIAQGEGMIALGRPGGRVVDVAVVAAVTAVGGDMPLNAKAQIRGHRSSSSSIHVIIDYIPLMWKVGQVSIPAGRED